MKKTTAARAFVLALSCLLWACSSTELQRPHSHASRSPNSQKDNPLSDDFNPTQKQSGQGFEWPVNEARLTRGFFTKPKKRRGRPHLGIDLAAIKGTPIYASHDGFVIYVGKEFRGYGRMVMVEGREGYATLYAHLSAAKVRAGDRVRRGDVIALMGNTGRSTGTHLHFEIRRKDGPVDPLIYLPGGGDILKRADFKNYFIDQAQLSEGSESWMDQFGLALTPASMRAPAQAQDSEDTAL